MHHGRVRALKPRRRTSLLRAREGAARDDYGGEDEDDEGIGHGPGLFRYEQDALLEARLAAVHGRRRAQERRALFAGNTDKRPAIGRALIFAQALYRRLVTGELRIAAREHRRQPDEGVIPVQDEAGAAQDGPDVVAVAVVRQLVLDAVPERQGVRRRLARDVDGPAEQAGRLHRVRDVHRQSKVVLEALPALTEPRAEHEVRPEEPQRHRGHAAVPDIAQDIRQRDRRAGLGLRRLDLRLVLGGVLLVLRLALRLRQRRVGLGDGDVGQLVVYISHNLFGDSRVCLVHNVLHADLCLAYVQRHEQAQEHDEPHGILQPRAYPAAQDAPQYDHGEDKHRG